MAQQTFKRDWTKELEKTKERIGGKYFKVERGTTYTVVFLDDGGPEYIHTFLDNTTQRVDFQVKVKGGIYEGEEMVWSINVGGPDSLWGMLNTVFEYKGKAADEVIHVSASGEGRKKRYNVKEYNDLAFTK